MCVFLHLDQGCSFALRLLMTFCKDACDATHAYQFALVFSTKTEHSGNCETYIKITIILLTLKDI